MKVSRQKCRVKIIKEQQPLQQCAKRNNSIQICVVLTLRCANAGCWTADTYWLSSIQHLHSIF
jgi:hypothetical protein